MKEFLPVAVPEDWGVRMERNCFDPKLGDGGFCLVGFAWFVILGVRLGFFVCLGFLSVLKRKIKIQLLKSLYTSLCLEIPRAEPWARSRLRRRPQASPPWQGCTDHKMHPAELRFKALVCSMRLCQFNSYFPSALCTHHRMAGWNMDAGSSY